MFSVNGIGGEVFRGSLENLLKVHHVPRSSRTPETGRQADETPSALHLSPRDTNRYQAAAAAYTRTLAPQPNRGPLYHAYQVMSRDVVTLPREATIEQAWLALTQRGIGQAPVIDRTDRLVGLLSRERILHVLNEEDGRLRDVLPRSVSDVMTTPVVTAAPVTEVRRMVRVMLEYGLPALPILDESSALAGIVSRRDILNVVVTDPPLTLWG